MIPLCAALVAGSAALQGPTAPPATRLVVLIAVDQMRADYLARFSSQWTGGFARLYHGGTVFEHGQQDHAATETAPGHSTLLSGRYPAHTGIALNNRGVQDRSSPVLGADNDTIGASPRRFRGTTLVDWMLARDSGLRVLSVSRKDRAAIFPIGRARAPVYWFYNGAFSTSRYYADTLPSWVRSFNAGVDTTAVRKATWSLLLPDSAYAEADSVPYENGGADYLFPHRFVATAAAPGRDLSVLPAIDSLTLAFALAGIHALRLGSRGGPDLLSISLSNTDAVGHAFGPDSREIHDHLLHVDRWLGQFLDSLSQIVPAAGTVLVLTADHGVTSIPEYTFLVRHQQAGRVSINGVAWGATAALARRTRGDFAIEADGGLISADVEALRSHGVDVDSLSATLAEQAGQLRGVVQVYTPRTLALAPGSDSSAVLWRRLLPPDYGWLICAITAPGYVWSAGGPSAEHGGAHPEDIAVPIVFYGPGIRAQLVERPVSTVDIGPTLAALVGVTPTEPVDGHLLPEVIGH